MARPPNPRIRERLRNQAVDYVLSHGVRGPRPSSPGESPEDQRSYARLPLRLAGGIDARNPYGLAGTWRCVHPGLVPSREESKREGPGREEPPHAIRVSALVLAAG